MNTRRSLITTDVIAMRYRSRTDEQLYDVTSDTPEDAEELPIRQYAKLAARILHRMDQNGEQALEQAA